jgi:2-(1,2-epoxy-1,2-dihydrophenyl)acetyl-CoA isomerase
VSAKVRLTFGTLPSGRRHARVTLAAPERCNALDPETAAALVAALAEAAEAGTAMVLLDAEGRHFSTGGDVAAFLEAAEAGRAEDHAAATVGPLHEAILTLRRMDAIAICAAQGAITGGSAGLLMACDLAVLGARAFVQPYYAPVGYAPDGGWTAQLPEILGARRALAAQLLNRRIGAAEAVALGLAEEAAEDDPAGAAQVLLARLDAHVPGAMIAAKRLVWDGERLAALERRLAAEQAAFAARIGSAEAREGMRRFLAGLAKG